MKLLHFIMATRLTLSSSNRSDSLVAIIPEGTTEKMLVSKVLLCQTSDYFVSVLNGQFKESNEQTLRFPGWSADVIELFVYWAYKWVLPQFQEKTEDGYREREATSDQMTILVRLWMFGDAHLIPRLQNCVMFKLLDLCKDVHTTAKILKLAYENAPRGSALSRFAIDEARFEYFSNDEEHLTEEDFECLAQVPGFLSDFMRPVRARLEVLENDYDTMEWRPAHRIGASAYATDLSRPDRHSKTPAALEVKVCGMTQIE